MKGLHYLEKMQTEYPKLQQEVAAYREQAAELAKTQEKAQTLQTQLQDTQVALEKARKDLDFTISQSTKDVAVGLEQAKKESAVGLEQAKKESAAALAQNVELKKQLENESGLRKAQEQKFQATFTRNAELEKKYSDGVEAVRVKEQLLQQVLTEKTLLEKKFEEGSSPYKTLQTQLEQAETQNIILQEQLLALRKTPGTAAETPPETAAGQAALQQEQTLRQRAETDLTATRNQVQTLQQQLTALAAQLASRSASPAAPPPSTAPAGAEGLNGAMRALFPRDLLQRAGGGALTALGWSPNRTKLAYQESAPQTERIWLFNTLTKQFVKLTEWQNPAAAAAALSQVAWAADNEHLLVVTGAPGKYLLALGNSRGLIGRPVALNEQEVCLAWSPTQLQFAYFAGGNLVIQTVNGKTLPLQLNGQPDAAGAALQWSPDGAMIAFSLQRDASVDIFTLNLAAGEPVLQTLVASPADDLRPAWSPDAWSASPPPHCSSSTFVPGGIAAPSRESTSMIASRSAGSPTSSRGVPAATTRVLSSNTCKILPLVGEVTSTGARTAVAAAPLVTGNSFNSASACRSELSAAISSFAAEVSRHCAFSRSCCETDLSANSFSTRCNSLAANRCCSRALSTFAAAVSRRASASARLRASSIAGATGSITATTVLPASTSAPALNGIRRKWPMTGADTT